MAVVVRELVKVAPKRIWPHTHFSSITAETHEELVDFAKGLGLSLEQFSDMEYHPHFKIPKDLFDKAIKQGAKVLDKLRYESFVFIHHS